MTTVKIIRKDKHIVKVSCSGHTGYDCEGEDIVCASLSSIVQTAVLGLMQIMGININLKRDFKNGDLSFELPTLSERDRHDADMILDTMFCGIADLYSGYSDFIELEA